MRRLRTWLAERIAPAPMMTDVPPPDAGPARVLDDLRFDVQRAIARSRGRGIPLGIAIGAVREAAGAVLAADGDDMDAEMARPRGERR